MEVTFYDVLQPVSKNTPSFEDYVQLIFVTAWGSQSLLSRLELRKWLPLNVIKDYLSIIISLFNKNLDDCWTEHYKDKD